MHRTYQLWVITIVAAAFSVIIYLHALLPSSKYPSFPRLNLLRQDAHAALSLQPYTQIQPNEPKTVTVTSEETVSDNLASATATSEKCGYEEGKSHHSSAWDYVPASGNSADRRGLNIAIAETNGVHEEVMAAMIHSLGSQREVTLHLYKKEPRFGIQDIVSSFALPREVGEWQPWEEILKDGLHYTPDILVLITCYSDPINLAALLETLLREGKTYIFCVVHETVHWDEPIFELDDIMRPWAEKKLLDLIALSPAVARTLEEKGMQTWPRQGEDRIQRSIRTFAPIFPIELSPLPCSEDDDDLPDPTNHSIAMQGLFDYERRDFDTAFDNFQKFLDGRAANAEAARALTPHQDDENNAIQSYSPFASFVQLQILGHGEFLPEVPLELEPHITILENLPYKEFYTVLSRQVALLPAFSSDIYRWMKASSSIAAALISGCPVIVDEKILRAYSYLTEDAVYIQKEGETEFDVLERVLEEPLIWRVKKVRKVRLRAEQIAMENALQVREWITKAEVETGWFR